MHRTFARTALVFSIMLLAALVCTTTAQTARAEGPAKHGGAAAKPKPKAVKRAAKPAAKSAGKPAAKPRSKAVSKAPKRAHRQRVPRALGPKAAEPAKPATETPKDGETEPSEREKNAGKLDGRKWRPRRRG